MGSSGLWSDIRAKPLVVLQAIGLHLVLLVLLSISLSSSEVPDIPAPNRKTVKAVVVDAAKVDAEIRKLKQAEEREQQQKLEQQKKIKQQAERAKHELENEKKRLAELKKKQAAEKRRLADLKKKNEAEQKKAAEAEKQRQQAEAKKAEAEKKRLADEARKKQAEKERLAAEAEQRRKDEQAELKRKLEEEERQEEEARRAEEHNNMLKSLRAQYVKLIEQKVERNWLRPGTSTTDMSCEVIVTQTSLGDVISVSLQQCANDVAFQRSIERAVRKASPLPPPPNPEVFDREIHFTFRPRN